MRKIIGVINRNTVSQTKIQLENMRLFFSFAHQLLAATKVNSLRLGPFREMNMSFSNVLVLRLLHKSVLILFMALKASSQSAVETGKATALEYSLTTRGNSSQREAQWRSSLATSCRDFASFNTEWFLVNSTNSPYSSFRESTSISNGEFR